MGTEEQFEIEVNGVPLAAREGQTVAAALAAAGVRVLRRTASGGPRGVFCGMGVCFECLVTVDGEPNQRACMTPVRRGCRVETVSAPVLPGAARSEG